MSINPGARASPRAAIRCSPGVAFKSPISTILSPERRTLTFRAGPPSPSSTDAPSIRIDCADAQAASAKHETKERRHACRLRLLLENLTVEDLLSGMLGDDHILHFGIVGRGQDFLRNQVVLSLPWPA